MSELIIKSMGKETIKRRKLKKEMYKKMLVPKRTSI